MHQLLETLLTNPAARQANLMVLAAENAVEYLPWSSVDSTITANDQASSS